MALRINLICAYYDSGGVVIFIFLKISTIDFTGNDFVVVWFVTSK